MEMAERNQVLHDWQGTWLPFHRREVIQLTELAVQDRLPPYATDDDMYEALDKCGMTVEEIFDELDRRMQGNPMDDATMEHTIRCMLFERFDQRLLSVTAHRVPL
jgi:hypothetical protein